MLHEARTIFNPRTGQRMRFLLTAAETNGELLRIETLNPPSAVAEPMHIHPRQDTRADVLSGALRFVVDGHERRVGPGESVSIPAGAPHRFWNDGDADAIAIQEARPHCAWLGSSRRTSGWQNKASSIIAVAPRFCARPCWGSSSQKKFASSTLRGRSST